MSKDKPIPHMTNAESLHLEYTLAVQEVVKLKAEQDAMVKALTSYNLELGLDPEDG